MVFGLSVAVVLVVVLFGIASPSRLSETATALLNFTTEQFGWFYLVSTFGFLLFCLYLAFSRYGNIRLGRDEDEPEYPGHTWFAMLFSAGMGIGLVFWGVAEPLSHFGDPPMDAVPRSAEAARLALRFSFFHWGLHAWAIYTVIALAIAYFSYRKGYSVLISSTLRPLLGERVDGAAGKLVDSLATIATAFGVATSLGLGTLQINGGLAQVFGLPVAIKVQLGIIVVVTILYLGSATSGLDRGIRLLSNGNMLLALGLLLFTLLAGPTVFVFDVFISTLGGYLQNLVSLSLRLAPFTEGAWIRNWTLFYWAWWIAWAPFVGLFIARISRGRTIKEFILGVLLVPSLFSFAWFSVFGGTALKFEIFDGIPLTASVEQDVTSALFLMLQQLPFGIFLSGIATALILIFFVTSADSATFVLGMLSTGGSLNPGNRVKVVWGVLQSSAAAVLLLSGGLQGLQAASIVAAAPFCIVMALMCVSLLRSLDEEWRQQQRLEQRLRRRLLQWLNELDRRERELDGGEREGEGVTAPGG